MDEIHLLQAAFVATDEDTERFGEAEEDYFDTLDGYAQAGAGLVKVLLSVLCEGAIALLEFRCRGGSCPFSEIQA